MLKSLSFVLVISLSFTASAQKKIIRKLMSGEKDTTRSSSFLPLPAFAYAQETGFEFGIIGLYAFYTDRKDTLTRNSSINGIASFTTKKQANLTLLADIWAPQNKYHYLAGIRYKNFPFNFYGIGDNTLNADKDLLVQKFFKLNGEIEKRISKNYFIGLTASYEHYTFKDKEAGGIYEQPNNLFTGRSGGKVLYVGISQIIDTRNTNTYTRKGSMVKVNYSFAPDIFGETNFTGSLLKADLRTFKSISSKTTLAIQAVYQSLIGDNNPFYLLPQLGNDQIMRGYYLGRYRDENLIASQAELRYRFIPRLGIVAFLGAGSVYSDGNFSLSKFKPSYGAGARYFFDVERGLSIRFDYALGEKRANEKRQSGFYVSLSESF